MRRTIKKANTKARYCYRVGTDKGVVYVEANDRRSASALARQAGYTVNDICFA